jgi:hypothetical protein
MELKQLNKIFNEFGKYMVKQSRANLTRAKKGDGSLYKSISYKVNDSKKDVVEWSFYMENYGVFQDQGVRGADPSSVDNPKTNYKGVQKAPNSPFSYRSKKPPMEPLRSWAKSKNIRFRQGRMVDGKWKSTGKYAKGGYDTIAFWLQKRIYAQGLKPSYFYTKPFDRAWNNLSDEVFNSFQIEIDTAINKTLN